MATEKDSRSPNSTQRTTSAGTPAPVARSRAETPGRFGFDRPALLRGVVLLGGGLDPILGPDDPDELVVLRDHPGPDDVEANRAARLDNRRKDVEESVHLPVLHFVDSQLIFHQSVPRFSGLVYRPA